ncbi:anhydro-N-acetylmuramic acid kinase [Nakamurella sp. UYEF19]|uniref:anhydro-N-acetylmuramic acid kinase n=1 Tax=Nakamurella sp. UYEF19 TaxID=1756392 RepID=UPI003392A42C
MIVIGLISGTSYDAIDAAVAEIRQEEDTLVLRPLGLHGHDMPERLRAEIAAALPPHQTTLEEVCKLDTKIGQLFGEVAVAANEHYAGGRADLVVSHGQTVYHWVEGAHALGTLQLGGAAWIAAACGVPVVSDLRTRDITVGGHAAPLASTLDALLLLHDGVRRGSVNLGGISNITVLGDQGEVVAYDIGPASALMDSVVVDATDGAERMDLDGAGAARGVVDERLLEHFLAEPYYGLPAPRSTGKELFHADYVRNSVQKFGADITTDDLLATLTELTAVLVAGACTDHGLTELVVAGGGVRNPTLMRRIQELCAPVRVTSIDEYGLPPQAKEAYLFAMLGYLTVHGLPGTIATATGARAASILGSITPGTGPLVLPAPSTVAVQRLRIEAE